MKKTKKLVLQKETIANLQLTLVQGRAQGNVDVASGEATCTFTTDTVGSNLGSCDSCWSC
jgi:hypothetical protein